MLSYTKVVINLIMEIIARSWQKWESLYKTKIVYAAQTKTGSICGIISLVERCLKMVCQHNMTISMSK